MSDFINSHKEEFNKVLLFLDKEIGNLRIGRATPALVENVQVDAYGVLTPLVHLAGIAASDPKTLTIQPWDKSLIKEIEKAILKADLGFNPLVKEGLVIINIPSLTEETRKEVVKKLHVKLEDAKVSIRGVREKIRDKTMEQEKDKTITEDEKFKNLDELDKLVKDYNEKIKALGDKKEEDIMKI
ncbi:MAG: ribosome recycling factor [Candidatus Komeilibacteria bacterium]|nr:ribosome recycling factor [Candidatus Komeilibacteria bacterium]